MKTLENTSKRKIKMVEVKYSNMTFEVQSYSHYMKELENPTWVKNRYTAKIKETGENIGFIGDRKLIRAQMELINSKPQLFLR